MESGMVKARDADDIINSVVAGLATGALYKRRRGLGWRLLPELLME
ncbi:hypothetical protein Lser_V15G37679 [Lactuca serriola]